MRMTLLAVLVLASVSCGAEESAPKSPAPEKCFAPPSPETLAQLNKMMPDLASNDATVHQKAFDGIATLGEQVLVELNMAVRDSKDEPTRQRILAVITRIESNRKNR